jgi:hypothetical protein
MDINKIIKKVLNEATSDGGGRGSYVAPLQLGVRPFKDSQIKPFTIPVSKYDSPMLEFDSYDGKMDETKKQIKKIESKAKKITNYIKKHPESTFSDDDGNAINPTPGKNKKFVPIKESSTSVTAGPYTGPIELGLKKWKKQHLGPFQEFVDIEFNHKKKQKTMKNNIKKTVGVWEKNSDGTYDSYEHDVHTISEDLAVWFGTKKKPKGSKQPKGPWVNICRKVDGKHPPCGRPEAGSKGYPKCRAVGVAGKMSDSQKRAACQQKRNAEKKDTQTGKGQKPIMTSYKPKNESMKQRIITLTEGDILRIVNRILSEETNAVDKDGLTIYKGELSPRKMYYAQESTNLTEEEYDGLVYGYTKLGDKIVKAKKYLRYGDVTLHCAELNSGNKNKIVTYQPSTFYETRFVDMEKQKDSDIQWLKPFCFVEKLWKKVKPPKY